MKKNLKLFVSALFVAVCGSALAAPARTGPWTKEQAWKWYDAQPWIRGCNYVGPASSPNRYDMWQVWDSERRFGEMDRELALAESIGFNTVRVFVVEDNGFAVWCEDHDGFMSNLERFLTLCAKHKIRAIIVLGNDCSRPRQMWSVPKPGPQSYDWGYQAGRKKSQHGSFPGAVGFISADDPELQPKFFQMCGEVMEKYKDDDRILFWNIWNEPGNNGRGRISEPLIRKLFHLAWSTGVKQPCAADIWRETARPNNPAEAAAAELSDIVSYHSYVSLKKQISVARQFKAELGRPLVNTEWLARTIGCNVRDCYPFFAQERIGCTCFGFVAGKSQWYEPWEFIWTRVERGKGDAYDMTKWFHDLFRPSLRPYDPGEIAVIKHVNEQMDAEMKGESLRAKIAKSCRVTRQDMWHGYRRTQFEFAGRTAWIVEPSSAARRDRAWTWTMAWPDINAERTCVPDLLRRGLHHVYIELFDTRMDDVGVAAATAFQSFLVKELGFAPKARLIGLSWGGFMSARYAAERPANVARIYFDNARLSADFAPVLAKEGIAALVVYGTSDIAVKPEANSKAFLAGFTAAGGVAKVLAHPEYGHHPHGVEADEAHVVLDFLTK